MAENTRSRILSSCHRVIARHGLAAFTMQQVAADAGVSIGLLAYHFTDRSGLLRAALGAVNAGVEARSRARPSTSPEQELRTLLLSEFDEDAEHRAGSILWNEVRARAVFDPEQADAISRTTAAWQDTVTQLLARSRRESGSEAAPDALILTALVEGLAGRWLTGQISGDEAAATLERALGTLCVPGAVTPKDAD